MKKILIIICLVVISAPVFGVCSITGGACTAETGPNWSTPALQDKLVPNNLDNLNKTDAFQNHYVKPYNPNMINTDQNSVNPETNDYNSNCQFGICLPGVEPEGEVVE